MDYSKLLKQDLIELLEQRSFADFIYKEEAEMRKILLKQISDKDEEIKQLHKDLSSQQYLQANSQRQINKLSYDIIDRHDEYNKELYSIKNKLVNAEKLIDKIEDLFEVFLDLCKDQESKDLLIKIINRNSIQSIKKPNDDGFDDLDLDFDELDREVSASQELDLDDDDLDLDFDEFEDDLDDSLSDELDDDLDDDLDEDLELDDDLDDLEDEFSIREVVDEMENVTDTQAYAEKLLHDAAEEYIAKNPDKKTVVERFFKRKK